MRERVSILEEITRGGYEASLITTYNAFLPFYEDVVLRRLIGQGVRHNVLMMDAIQCGQSVKHNPPRFAGRNYSLLPIQSKGAFHPKIVLLVGKNNGAVLIGSHNLTLSGFGYNREITNFVRIEDKDDQESKFLIQSAWQQVLWWVQNQEPPMPEHLVEMIVKLKDFAPWLNETYDVLDNIKIISSQKDERSLWNQLRPFVDGTAKRVIVSGAFFDAGLSFLKRVQEDLKPQEMVVGIDPDTVQIPSKETVEGIIFVDARKLGSQPNKDDQLGYLHAKSIFISTEEESSILATGSANPSAPAWLSPASSGNTEMMLIQTGESAKETARELGLLELPKKEALTEIDWQKTEENWQKQYEKGKEEESSKIGIALATEKGIHFNLPSIEEQKNVDCQLLSENKRDLGQVVAQKKGHEFVLFLEEETLRKASYIQVAVEDNTILFLVHHQSQIEEHSRTGSQRRFREALSSLNTDTPDIETLINCVDKIIFASTESINKTASQIREIQRKEKSETFESSEGTELSTDLSETRKAKKKYRIRQSDDLGYLLDVLIYHLRLEAEGLDSAHEHRDAKGRSEEEQIGADDEDERHEGPSEEEIALKTLALCHGKVRSLTGRMINQLNALKNDRVSFNDAIIRLTGVLAVLRQLRNCDGKVAWVKQGQTTFPLEERRRLFDAIVNNMFEAPHSVLYPENEHPDLSESDEIARLRGLVLWLAWDSGIQFIEKKDLFEERDKEEARLYVRALMLALAQLVRKDEVVMKEARQSIAPLCSSDMDWLNWMFEASKVIEEFKEGKPLEYKPRGMSKGDIAYLSNLPHLGVRLVLNTERDKAYLAFMGHESNRRKFLQRAMRSMKMSQLSS